MIMKEMDPEQVLFAWVMLFDLSVMGAGYMSNAWRKCENFLMLAAVSILCYDNSILKVIESVG